MLDQFEIELPEKDGVNARSVAENLNDYAVNLRKLNRSDVALVAADRALATLAGDALLHANRGCILLDLLRVDEAHAEFVTATELDPSNGDNWGNLGLTLWYQRRYQAALSAFERAESCAKTTTDALGARWSRSLLLLELGSWKQGFIDYESRIELRGAPLFPKMPVPTWTGEDLAGKTLYVAPEQGIGDRILFSRFFSVIKERWPTCHVLTCCPEHLMDLMWEHRHVVDLLPHGVPWPDGIDYGVYQASLPGILGVTPDNVPGDPGLIKKRVDIQRGLGTFHCPEPLLGGLKIGIAWTGNPTQNKNHERTVPLQSLLSTLGPLPGLTLYSFQVDNEEVTVSGAGQLICDLGPDLKKIGLVSAGVAMQSMDLMITVCTSTAHLAGSLGIPTYLLLCNNPYWVWLQNEEVPRKDSIWYPSVKIFRQRKLGDWSSVLTEVRAELENRLSA